MTFTSEHPSLSAMREDYDWQEAMERGGAFGWDDIADVLAKSDGQNDEESWIAVFALRDGRFGFLTAWCDYTGWGCQDGGNSVARDDLRTLMLNDVGEEDWKRLGWSEAA